MKKKKYIKVAKEVIDLEIKALIKLKKSINESFKLAVQQIIRCQSKIILQHFPFLRVTLLMEIWEVFQKKIF